MFFTACILFSLMTLSCTHQSEKYEAASGEGSVKREFLKAKAAVSWTAPVEPDALSAEPAGKNSSSVFYPSAGFAVISGESPVLPSLEGFGSLDTSGMSREIFDGISDFLLHLSEKSLSYDAACFDRPYEGVIILYEASSLPDITGWKAGKPFISEGEDASYEIPVRLYFENGMCDVRMYLNPEKAARDEVSVQQVIFGAIKSE